MTIEKFVRQLDGCTYCSGGQNCTCACEAMWLYRASQGRVSISACTVRRQTGDRTEGTNLEQMRQVSILRGFPGGMLYRPARFDKIRELILTGRYGAIIQGGYSQIAGSQFDCFDGNFRGAHAIYLSRGSTTTAHGADPGADGRRPTIPTGYQNYPWAMLERFASALPLNDAGLTLGKDAGSGYVYAYVTPADPLQPTQKYVVSITGFTPIYAAPNAARTAAVSKATYICTRSKVTGLWWYRILTKADGTRTANAGHYFKPNGYTTARWLE
jgi:hypothetical protein